MRYCSRMVYMILIGVLSGLWCGAALPPEGLVWMSDEFSTALHDIRGSMSAVAVITNGMLHVRDTGTTSGDMVFLTQHWKADPGLGSVTEARVKVVSCEGLAGVMLGVADGVHEDILTLYTDKIELRHSGKNHLMDTTDGFHIYRVEIKGTDIRVLVDGKLVIDAPGGFLRPAHIGRNHVSYGAGSSAATGEAFWDWIRWTQKPIKLRAHEHLLKDAAHSQVFKEPGSYSCFPSLLMIPDNEYLFTRFAVQAVASHHATAGSRSVKMSSVDGGKSWHEVASIPEEAEPDQPRRFFTAPDGAQIRIGHNWFRWYPMERLSEFRGRYHITYSGGAVGRQTNTFATLTGGYMERSEDGGKTWQRKDIPELDAYMAGSSPWSCTQLADGTILRSFMVSRSESKKNGVAVAITRDGKTSQVVDVVRDPENELNFTEEALMYTTSQGIVWLLIRVHGKGAPVWQAVSSDGGQSWEAKPTDIDARITPMSGLVKLDDGRLVVVYGYRDPPFGIRALVSEDEGLTWRTDHVLVLRDDGEGLDLGYPHAFKLSDNTVVTIYYFATDDKVRHIASTRFKVPELPPRR